MRLKDYFDKGLASTLLYAALGAATGYASFLMNNPKTAFVSAIVVLALSAVALKTLLRVNYKWLVSNGIMMFVFAWFIAWTVFYNMGVA